jgi:hypothetical protein
MPVWDDVVRAATDLPETEPSTMHGSACLRVHGKAFAVDGSHVEGYIVLWCAPEEKAALLASGDPAFCTTPHYDGHGSILVDLDRVDAGQLAELVTDAWRLRAPVRLRKAFDAD